MQNVAPETWDQMQHLFHLSWDRPDEELGAFLEEASPDADLRAQVMMLVRASRTSPSALSEVEEDTGAAARSRFGSNKVLRHLGTGGTGTVFLVERRTGSTAQKAALKVFPGYDPESFFTRSFAREEFILASLSHPSIPQLLDAGVSESGEPFLVMEFVEGQPLDVFCENERLSVEARVRLMLRVCDAVAYAHRNLVVHLDLKPSNILASREQPQIKLLDFGTSKLLEAGRTLAIAQMVTPAYAAPEQLRREPATTSCDVYSLGAILFELLSGRLAFPDTSLAAVAERSTRDVAPQALGAAVTPEAAEQRSSTIAALQRQLRGEISTIVNKCMESKPVDRYASVDALADDLHRYLDGRPLRARPQTLLYRAGKFVRRYAAAVLAVIVAVLLIVGSVALALWRQHQALAAAHRAVQMQQFMTRLFGLAHTGATGKPAATVGDLLQIGEETLPSFISDPADLRAAKMSIAESMYDDEDTKRALPLLLQLGEEGKRTGDVAVEARADILASDLLFLTSKSDETAGTLASRALFLSHDKRISPELRTQIIAMYVQNKDSQGDRSTETMDRLRSAIAESESHGAPEDQTASAMNILALGLQARDQYREAMEYFDRSLAIYARTPYSTCDAAATVRYRGRVEEKLGDDHAALLSYQHSYQLQQQCAGPDDLGTLSAHAWYAQELAVDGDPKAAIAAVEPELPKWRAVVGADSMHMATPYFALGGAYLAAGRNADAEAVSRDAIRVLKGHAPQKSLNMAIPEQTLAAALAAQKRYAEAAPWAEAAVRDFPVTNAMPPGIQRRYDAATRMRADIQTHLTGNRSAIQK